MSLMRPIAPLLMRLRKSFLLEPDSTITIDGKTIQNLVPLGGYRVPGITKAGRLSFSGICDGRKVKVYSLSSPSQGSLRAAIQSPEIALDGLSFPEIIASDQFLVAEAWIEGLRVDRLSRSQRHEARLMLSSFMHDCRNSPDLLNIAANHQCSFCYIHDYLLERLAIWMNLDPVQKFVNDWYSDFHKLEPSIARNVSHPDLSARNLILESTTDTLYVIDNELLGVGPGWILDHLNSCLPIDQFPQLIPSLPSSFIDKTWKLRCLGSTLDSGNIPAALRSII